MGHLLSRRTRIVRPDLAGPVPGASRPAGRKAVQIDPRGLGDLVERLAKPIARWLDSLAHRPPGRRTPPDPALAALLTPLLRTRLLTLPLAGCSACSRRRRALNRILPDVHSWAEWWGVPRRLLRALQRAFGPLAKLLPHA